MAIFSDPHLLNTQRWKGMRVGLLGGSFNPPHMGHVHISRIVLRSLKLDALWWLVTPQNPLKSKDGMLPLDRRLELSAQIMDHPQILVTNIESALGTHHTYGTVIKLKRHFPQTEFAWITGMDNAHTLHHWNHWRELLNEICMVHVTRHPPVKLMKQCPVRMLATQRHIILDRGRFAALSPNTTYWLLQKKMVNISSTEIRNKISNKSNTYI